MDDAPSDLPSRVAVLEEIAHGTKAAFERIDCRLDSQERRLETMDASRPTDVRWLLSGMLGGFGMTIDAFGALLGVMAQGFHWL